MAVLSTQKIASLWSVRKLPPLNTSRRRLGEVHTLSMRHSTTKVGGCQNLFRQEKTTRRTRSCGVA